MNDNAKAWVAALRSGKYQQGARRLSQGGRYCCLGVACELAIAAGVRVRREQGLLYGAVDPEAPIAYDGETSLLPLSVQEWLGLAHSDGRYGGIELTLARDNDRGATFAQIADIIESEPEGMFV